MFRRPPDRAVLRMRTEDTGYFADPSKRHAHTATKRFSAFRHHVSQEHLKRYLAEFDFRYNERQALGVNDGERMPKSIGGIVGKRLTYRRTRGAEEGTKS